MNAEKAIREMEIEMLEKLGQHYAILYCEATRMKLSSNNGIFSFLKSHILKKKILCGPPCSCAYICMCHHINMLAVRCAFQHRNLRSVFDLVFVRNENIAKLSKHTHMHGYSKKRMNLLMYWRPGKVLGKVQGALRIAK